MHLGLVFSSCMVFLEGIACNFWTYALPHWSYPAAFSSLLVDEPTKQKAALACAKAVWETSTWLEQQAHVHPGLSRLRDKIWWLDTPHCQLRFRILDHFHFVYEDIPEEVWQWFRRTKKRLGDSAVIENSNKRARRAEADGSSNSMSSHRLLHHIRRPAHNAIEERGISHVEVPKESWESATVKLKPSWKERSELNARIPKLDGLPDVERILQGKAAGPSVSSRPNSVAALHAAMILRDRDKVGDCSRTWMACALSPGSLVRCSDACTVLFSTLFWMYQR